MSCVVSIFPAGNKFYKHSDGSCESHAYSQPSFILRPRHTFLRRKRRFAEEYKQRVAARDWATAHQLFAEELAPRWWLAGQHSKLRSQLQPLLKAAQEAQAQVDTAQWQIGAELYATYFDVEVGDTLTRVRQNLVRKRTVQSASRTGLLC